MIKNFNSFDKIKNAKSDIDSIIHILTDGMFEVNIIELKEVGTNGEDFLAINIDSTRIIKNSRYPFRQIEYLFQGDDMEEFLDRLNDISSSNDLEIYKVSDEDKMAHLTLKVCCN